MSRYSISYSISIRRKRLPVKILNNLGFKSLIKNKIPMFGGVLTANTAYHFWGVHCYLRKGTKILEKGLNLRDGVKHG